MEQTDAVATAYGLTYEPAGGIENLGHFDHTSLVVVVDPDGIERHRYLGTGWNLDLLSRLEADIAAYKITSDKAVLTAQDSNEVIFSEPTSREVVLPTSLQTPLEEAPAADTIISPPAMDSVNVLRARAREFDLDSDDTFEDIDSELALQ